MANKSTVIINGSVFIVKGTGHLNGYNDRDNFKNTKLAPIGRVLCFFIEFGL